MRLTNEIKDKLTQNLLEASPLFTKARNVVADRQKLVEDIRQALLKQYELTDEKIDELKTSIKENGFVAVNVSKRDDVRVILNGECRNLKMDGLDEISYRNGKYVGSHTLECSDLFNAKLSEPVTKKYADHNRTYLPLNKPDKLYDRLNKSDWDIEILSKEVIDFRHQVKSALSQITTVNKLKEVWPDAVPFLPATVKKTVNRRCAACENSERYLRTAKMMRKWLAKRFGSATDKIIWPESREIDYTSQRWGHALQIGDTWNTRKKFDLNGHYSGERLIYDKSINEGDVLLIRLKSGKVGMLRVYKIKWFRDPSDMFSATVCFEGVKE